MNSNPTHEVDVVVVGAGLAGASAAKRLVDAGLDTIIIERKSLPRHKICSGILSPRGHRFLLENFGPLPSSILHEPTSCRGVTFHFPSAPSLNLDFDGGTTPHLHRKYSDHWAVQQSGAQIHDNTSFMSLHDDGDHVAIKAKQNGEPITYRCRWVVAADGPNSAVIRSLYPEYHKSIPWFMVGQKFHEIVTCPLDSDYFHFWFDPELGYYSWSHARDSRQIVGAGFDRGQNFDVAHRRVLKRLEHKHGVLLGDAEDGEACPENFGLSLINRYVFGKGRVVVTGQAAGFLNMMAEGMSCALHSGAIAGEAVVEASQTNGPVQEAYRKMIASEVQHCSDQWNPLKIVFGRPHEAELRGALAALSWKDRAHVVKELLSFVKIYAKFRWGRQIAGQALDQMLRGQYDSKRWL